MTAAERQPASRVRRPRLLVERCRTRERDAYRGFVLAHWTITPNLAPPQMVRTFAMYSSADAVSGTHALSAVHRRVATQVLGAGGLATFLACSGAAHFLIPKYVDGVVPGWLPGLARFWTYGSGIAELAVAVAVAHPGTRRTGAFVAAGMFAAVLPGNVKLAIDSRKRPVPIRLAAFARLPLQIPMVMWGLKVARRAVV